MISILKRGMSILLISVVLLCSKSAKGESMYRSNNRYTGIIQWNNQIIVVNMMKHMFVNEYRLFLVTPYDCVCILEKQVPYNKKLHYYASKDIIIEECVVTAAPLSYSTLSLRYSYCKGQNAEDLCKKCFLDLPPIKEGEYIATIDGNVLKYGDDHTLLRLDTDSNIWTKIDIGYENLWCNSDSIRDSCICIDKSEGLFYSPTSDDTYQFSAVKGVELVNYILNDNRLIYADDGGIYACKEKDVVPIRLVGSSPDFEINRMTTFCITNGILYVCNHSDNQLKRLNLYDDEMLPLIEFDYGSSSSFFVQDNYLYIVKDLEDTFETIEYISVVDLETNTEIKRHVIT